MKMTHEINVEGAGTVETSSSPASPGRANFAISMIDLILDDSAPKCLCKIISLATEQLLNTRNC